MSKIIGEQQPSPTDIFSGEITRKAKSITANPQHRLFKEFNIPALWSEILVSENEVQQVQVFIYSRYSYHKLPLGSTHSLALQFSVCVFIVSMYLCCLAAKQNLFLWTIKAWTELNRTKQNILHCLLPSYEMQKYLNSNSFECIPLYSPYITRKISSHSSSAGRQEHGMVLLRSLSFNIFHVSFTFSAAQYRLTADL